MGNKIITEKFCGINLFNWSEWDEVDTDIMQFYNVKFLLPSMMKFNGNPVTKSFDGKLEVYNDDGNILWSGWITDIPEVMEDLNKRK